MSNVVTVNSLATMYADRHLAHQNIEGGGQNQPLRNRIEYDFKVTGFNLTTAAAIVTLALAVLTNSVAAFVLWMVTYNIRKSFMRAVGNTALVLPGDPLPPNIVDRIANLNPVQRRNEIAAHLAINDPNWQIIQYQLFDFKGWMNWTPSVSPVAAHYPVN